jgi:hypothetical protein
MNIHKPILTFFASVALPALSSSFSCASSAEGQLFYVAPNGSDTAAGTEAAPFQSMDRAREAVRGFIAVNSTSPQDITVYFQEGNYAVQQSVVFTEADSAPAGTRIEYRACEDATVVFFGGVSLPVSAFQPLSAEDPRVESIIDRNAHKHIRYAPLKELGITDYGKRSLHGFRVGGGATPPMELFINGRSMTPARWPNEGLAPMDDSMPLEDRIIDAGEDWTPSNKTGKGGTFRVDFDRLKHWTNAEDMLLDGLVANDWSWQSHLIASMDAEQKTLTLQDPAPYTIKMTPRFYIENLLEEIDMPGEYFIDRQTGYLYLYPPAGMADDAFLCVSTLKEPMLSIEGASRLTFHGITFDTGREAAISLNTGEANRFSQLEVRNFTGNAVKLAGRNNGIVRSDIHHIGGSGVILEGGDFDSLLPGGNFVEDTTIHHFARYDKAYTPGVTLLGVGNRVSHCEIYEGPHGGITISGNDHLIEYNILRDLIKDFSDFGAIYAAIGANPLRRGTVIRRNLIYNLGAPGRKWCIGIYSDWFSQGFTIEENILYRIGDDPEMFEFIGIVNSSGRYNKVLNNIFIDCPIPYERGYNMSYGYKKNGKDVKLLKSWRDIFEDPELLGGIYGIRYPELHRFFDEDIWFPTTSYFERNLIYNKDIPFNEGYLPEHFIVDRTSKGWGKHEDLANARDNWVTNEDPGFINPSEMNLELEPHARAFDEIPGFRNIPFSQIGVRK